ncbi:hypothetical protein SKAU_G00056180 [Synaphobranchus kaupii]|uniref:Uncharacterized protein n=1 Tax=Synaphobranchus kaupii TaxID=118154 RepID=A0A9Q1G3W9_SYNKA|nr:hypothetical protein SKAU_G00056180 [Synaphobranchus kaupii]
MCQAYTRPRQLGSHRRNLAPLAPPAEMGGSSPAWQGGQPHAGEPHTRAITNAAAARATCARTDADARVPMQTRANAYARAQQLLKVQRGVPFWDGPQRRALKQFCWSQEHIAFLIYNRERARPRSAQDLRHALKGWPGLGIRRLRRSPHRAHSPLLFSA